MGAHLWFDEPLEQRCAQRLFELSCAAREHFACGMLARIRLETAKPQEREAIHRQLEAWCSDLGQFPCRVLALHIEKGDFGPSDPTRVKQLLARACETGDPDACDAPSADSTFRP